MSKKADTSKVTDPAGAVYEPMPELALQEYQFTGTGLAEPDAHAFVSGAAGEAQLGWCTGRHPADTRCVATKYGRRIH